MTIRSTGTVRITATVTPQDDSNYTGTESTWYELNIIGGGSMSMWVTPAQGLTYNGGPQNLLTAAGCTLEGAELSYRLEGENDWSATIPRPKTRAATPFTTKRRTPPVSTPTMRTM